MRAINVGGKNKLPMATLVALFERAGCTSVRTYIQSGNVVFAGAAEAARTVEATLEREHGLRVPVIVRSAKEIAAVVAGNPFLAEGVPEEWLHVVFLRDKPGARAAAALDPERSPGDRFVVRGREIYLHTPNGLGRTRLINAWFDAKLETVSTVRNWRTVLTLAGMATDRGSPAASGRRAGSGSAPRSDRAARTRR